MEELNGMGGIDRLTDIHGVGKEGMLSQWRSQIWLIAGYCSSHWVADW